MTRLFAVDDPPPEWTGTRLPAVYTGPAICGHCHHGYVARLDPYVLEPLFIAAGYGEAIEIHATRCPACGDTRVVERIPHRPMIRRRFKTSR